MTLWVILYATVAAFSIRPVTGHLAWNMANRYRQSRPDNGDWVSSAVIATMLAVIWAPILVGLLVTKSSTKLFPAVGAEKRAIEYEKTQRVKELERELEL